LDSAVEGLVDGIWFNQGQVCCAGSRLLVQESVAEKLTRKLQARMSTLRIGPPLDKAVDIGAIIARVQLERIDGLVKQGIAEGATCWQPEIVLPSRGWYYKPTLLSNVHPTSIVARQEIFGPVLAAMTFRTPQEAVQLANNTAYGLAASVWSESVNVALAAAAEIKAGVVWVNSTNLFDAASGFGGYRESGYGREGGREGLVEYLEAAWFKRAPALEPAPESRNGSGAAPEVANPITSIDRTVKLYIGGKQARPDSGYSTPVYGAKGELLGEAPLGNRKDIRNAVEAARKAEGWARTTAHNRAQVLYYIAENLSQRAGEIGKRLGRSSRRKAGGPGSSVGRGAHLFLRGVVRQIRWRGSQPAFSQHLHCHERADRNRGRALPGRIAAARISLSGLAAGRRRKRRGRRPVGKIPAYRRRPLSGTGNQRSAGRCHKSGHRQAVRVAESPCRTR
jgi:aldehyde dehydrogenase (NAD+)